MTSLSSSHDDFQSITISEDSTVSEGTRRLLSPYNRNRFDALNRDIQNELTKVKDTFRTIKIDLNTFQGAPEQLKEFKDKIRHMNRILLTVKQRQDVLDDRNEQMLLDLQNHIWEIVKYSVRIEIYLCAIERMKNAANELLQMAKRISHNSSNEYDELIEIGTKLKNEINLLETQAKTDCHNINIRENLDKLKQRCQTILNINEQSQLKTLRNFQVKKSILNHCRNRFFD
ncbi:unnamed protein product [Rotaria magnacalcarata]|uniref:Uncharacterized protein n=1 Tax=Rotaria magnacalcarata TaxID=392030 RepID=A0A816TJ79_9BILA|nr:unnamed protein product [Rotaria magnacalcarata]CAF1665562.1 unnamed protein product [Rotaria magnacalcarata]CAF2033281.1 unnamed protein product [Rotaria magnacalcarata]CAF2036257.1 unnamed protein product [Rotaria magnacalcarata]CAF2100244.1 unnamed protein product [Rotaria magnacalcarata]